ncbi:speckle-type POZ protein-like B [Nephila pilipes]|uniref:Speckle-type POZ protein-like B n=1 Tax=Nephila pilipes TaxID=299642 RepID=A0A8X6MPL0_NEPPI|nr:speckle-type POZ protein-like B [Nephila pilipes]
MDGCVTFYWSINNYSYCCYKKKRGIYSPDFIVNSLENTQWRLLLYPRGSTDENSIDYLLGRTSKDGPKSITVKCEFAFLAEDGSVLLTKERERDSFENGTYWGFEKFAKREELLRTRRKSFLPQDILRTRCRLWRMDLKPLKPITFHARTTVNVEKRNFCWNVEHFSTLDSDHKIIFPYWPNSGETPMNFIFSANRRQNMTITIQVLSPCENAKMLTFHAIITHKTGNELYCDQKEFSFNASTNTVMYQLPFNKKFLMQNKNLYLKNDVLSLRCEYGWSAGTDFKTIDRIDVGSTSPSFNNKIVTKERERNITEDEKDNAISLKKDLGSLYIKGILCDIKLDTTTESFPAHKVILCARSPVFQAMFTSNMKEKTRERVEVPDIEDDTMRRMLLYMYTDTLKDLNWESAIKLYSAADKYEILSLKDKCSHFLKINLCLTKVCEVLVLADMHMDNDLKEAVQHYALTHNEEVFHSDQWTEFTKSNTALAAETMLLNWKKNESK